MTGANLSVGLKSRVNVIVDVGRFESDAVDAAAVGADGNVVTHPGTSAVGARVAPFIGPG